VLYFGIKYDGYDDCEEEERGLGGPSMMGIEGDLKRKKS